MPRSYLMSTGIFHPRVPTSQTHGPPSTQQTPASHTPRLSASTEPLVLLTGQWVFYLTSHSNIVGERAICSRHLTLYTHTHSPPPLLSVPLVGRTTLMLFCTWSSRPGSLSMLQWWTTFQRSFTNTHASKQWTSFVSTVRNKASSERMFAS